MPSSDDYYQKNKELITSANTHLVAARGYIVAGDRAAALDAIGRVLRLDPSNAGALFERAKVHLMDGDSAGAIEDLDKTITLDPGNDHALVERGKLHWRQREIGRARQCYEAALQRHPENASAHIELGKVLRMQGCFGESSRELRRASELDPGNTALAAWLERRDAPPDEYAASAPYRIFFTWGLHYECNYRCAYCYAPKPEQDHFNDKPHRGAVYLPAGKLLSVWDGVYERYGSCRIRLDGGEPSIYPDFFPLIKGLSDKHFIQINTNLSFDIQEFLRHARPDRVRIDMSVHPEYTTPDECISKISLLQQNGYKVVVSFVAYPPFIGLLPEYKSRVEEKGIPFLVHPYSGECNGKNYPAEYTPEEKKILSESDHRSSVALEWRSNHAAPGETGEHVRTSRSTIDRKRPISAAELAKRMNSAGSIVSPGQTNNMPAPADGPEKICRMGFMYARVYPNGDTFRCCTDDGLLSLGNLYTGTFALHEQPRACKHSKCRCWRSMVPGEEERWLGTWLDDWEMPF
jgi:MoaA/NifB/PqqE/SkfB family radical SAM enzyme